MLDFLRLLIIQIPAHSLIFLLPSVHTSSKVFRRQVIFRALRDPFKVRPFVFINACDMNYCQQVANRSCQPCTGSGAVLSVAVGPKGLPLPADQLHEVLSSSEAPRRV